MGGPKQPLLKPQALPPEAPTWWQRFTGRAALEDLQQQIRQQTQELSQLHATLYRLQQELAQAYKDHEGTLEELEKHAVAAQASQTQLQESLARQQALKQSMHRLQAHAQRVVDKLQETEMFNQELWQENEAKQQSVEALQQQLTSLQHQSIEERNYYSQLLAELEQAGASQRVTHHTMQETLQHRIFDLQNQLAEQQELRAKEEEKTNQTILALQRTVGNRDPALLRVVWQRHFEILLAPFQGASDVSQALAMCQTWLTELQLCADFTAVQQDNGWEFSWQPLPAPCISSERDAVAPQISIIALLWALLNAKTTQQWHCCIIAESDTTHTRVVFSLPQ